MIGKLFGIGVGPGDPELLTLKAIKTIEKCHAIALPKSDAGESAAFNIVKQYLDGKQLIECRFTMEKDIVKRKKSRQTAADSIIEYLDRGQDVGFITLGDPTTYSTYMYIHEIIVGKRYKAEIVPGITSYAAASAALGIALCKDDEALTLIPARTGDNIDELLGMPGNKVIMKSGKNLACMLAKLKERGYEKSTKIACRVTLNNQRLYNSIEDYEKSPEDGYFTIAIVKNGHALHS